MIQGVDILSVHPYSMLPDIDFEGNKIWFVFPNILEGEVAVKSKNELLNFVKRFFEFYGEPPIFDRRYEIPSIANTKFILDRQAAKEAKNNQA